MKMIETFCLQNRGMRENEENLINSEKGKRSSEEISTLLKFGEDNVRVNITRIDEV
jgi:hypothetical protein